MTSMHKIACVAALTGILAGCIGKEAGRGPNDEVWGTAVANNNFVQTAYDTSQARLQSLGAQFAAEVPDTVTFAFDSARLDAGARSALNAQIAWLKAHPEVRLAVVGHTDLVGGEGYNARLGLRRAKAAVRFMRRRGVPADQVVAVETRGEQEPVVATEARERQNRRAVTVVAGFRRIFVGPGMDGRRALNIYRTALDI